MNPLLTRLLLSTAGATMATSALVFTAENRDRDLRRPKSTKKKAKKKKKGVKAKGAKAKAAKAPREKPNVDPLARARQELEGGSEPLPFDVFFANLKASPRAMVDAVSGKTKRDKAAAKVARKEKREQMSPAERRAADRRRARKRRAKKREDGEEWGIGASIRAEVKKQVKTAAADTIRETAEAAGDRFMDGADIVKEKTSAAAKRLAEAAPDVAASAKSVADGATRLSKSLVESVPDSASGVSKGLRSLGRWVEGPGAQEYDDDDTGPKLLEGENAAVSARVADDVDMNADDVDMNADDADDIDNIDAGIDIAADDDDTAAPKPAVGGRSIVQRRLDAARKTADHRTSTQQRAIEGRVRPVRSDDDQDEG